MRCMHSFFKSAALCFAGMGYAEMLFCLCRAHTWTPKPPAATKHHQFLDTLTKFCSSSISCSSSIQSPLSFQVTA